MLIGLSINKIIEFYRIKDWLHMLGLILLGFAYSLPAEVNFRALLAALLAGGLYLAHGYSLNDIFDKETKVDIGHRQALRLSLLSVVLCLLVASFISLKALYIAIFGHLCGMFYSASPFRFKNRLFWDLIFNALSLASLFLLGTMAAKGDISRQGLMMFFLFFVYFMPIQLIHQIQDYLRDKESGQKNTVQILGIKKATHLIFMFLAFYIILSFVLWELQAFRIYPLLLNSSFALVLIFYIGYNRTGANLKLATRYISIIYGVGLLAAFYLNI